MGTIFGSKVLKVPPPPGLSLQTPACDRVREGTLSNIRVSKFVTDQTHKGPDHISHVWPTNISAGARPTLEWANEWLELIKFLKLKIGMNYILYLLVILNRFCKA